MQQTNSFVLDIKKLIVILKGGFSIIFGLIRINNFLVVILSVDLEFSKVDYFDIFA